MKLGKISKQYKNIDKNELLLNESLEDSVKRNNTRN